MFIHRHAHKHTQTHKTHEDMQIFVFSVHKSSEYNMNTHTLDFKKVTCKEFRATRARAHTHGFVPVIPLSTNTHTHTHTQSWNVEQRNARPQGREKEKGE